MIRLGVARFLTKLWNATHDPILVITARPPHAYAQTLEVLQKNIPDVPFILVSTDLKKETFLNNHKYFVEDRRANALELADAGKFVYLVDTPYNQMEKPHPLIHRINAVEELMPLIYRFIK